LKAENEFLKYRRDRKVEDKEAYLKPYEKYELLECTIKTYQLERMTEDKQEIQLIKNIFLSKII